MTTTLQIVSNVLGAFLILGAPAVHSLSADQTTPLSLTDRISTQLGLEGWLALFDGKSTFGFQEAKLDDSRKPATLQGGTTTSEFSDYELNVFVAKAGTIMLGDESFELVTGAHTLHIKGKRGSIRLSSDLVVESLNLKPLDLKPLFNGRDLTGWDRRGRVPNSSKPGAKWTVSNNAIHVLGGPEALEYAPANGPHLFNDFIAQLVVCTKRQGANGGVFLRNEPGRTMMGYEIQLHNTWYDPGGKTHGYTTGGIDDREQARAAVAFDLVPFRLTIVAQGPHLATWVNGYQTADWTDKRHLHSNPRNGLRLEKGTFQLQAHDPETELEFQGIWLKE